jgi:N-acetylmuramoyl-L-alanine amidase
MKIVKKYMTQNDCYKAGRKIKVKGILVHSTATPEIMAADWFSRWNKSGIEKCVHAFLDDKEVWQYLPWDMRGWHAGGKANDSYIGFEICEPKNLNDKEYFKKAYANAVELCVMLCKEFKLTVKDILDHSEGHKKGIASNHGDVMHWFPKHGKDMDDFRADVKKVLAAATAPKLEPKKEEKKKAAKYGKVTATILNVRSGRGTDYKVIGKLEDGKKVKLLYLQDGWWSIDVPMEWSRTGVGFVSADYIKEVK